MVSASCVSLSPSSSSSSSPKFFLTNEQVDVFVNPNENFEGFFGGTAQMVVGATQVLQEILNNFQQQSFPTVPSPGRPPSLFFFFFFLPHHLLLMLCVLSSLSSSLLFPSPLPYPFFFFFLAFSKGIAFDQYPVDVFEGMSKHTGARFNALLLQKWIPLLGNTHPLFLPLLPLLSLSSMS
jgi:hypothetical protein